MRFPSIPAIILHTFSNTTSRRFPYIRGSTLYPAPRITVLGSMPTIPFISSLFSSSSDKMSSQDFPVQKTKGEWQAVLSKGKPQTTFKPIKPDVNTQSNSIFSARRVPK